MLLNPLFLFDIQNIVTIFRKPLENKTKCNDYTLLMPVHRRHIDYHLYSYLVNHENLSNVMIVDDSNGYGPMQQYLDNLKDQGFVIIRNDKPGFKWGALRNALNYVKTSYSIFLDDDTYPTTKTFSDLVGGLKETNSDITSVKCHASNVGTICERLQAIEYRIAMLGRENRKWITSGACIAAKTDKLKEIIDSHSGFREGGDIEIGLIAKSKKMKVVHSNFEVLTEIPHTFREWFSQREKWMAGNFRHTVVNLFSVRRDMIYLIYFFILIWTHIAIRYYLLFFYPIMFLIVIVAYIPITLIGNIKIAKKILSPLLLLYPLYALTQVMVISLFGILWYFRSAYEQDNYGFIEPLSKNV